MSATDVQTDQAAIERGEPIDEPMTMAAMREDGELPGLGWLRDLPDFRDYTMEDETIAPLLAQTSATVDAEPPALPNAVDLRQWFSPIEDQGQLGSCTA